MDIEGDVTPTIIHSTSNIINICKSCGESDYLFDSEASARREDERQQVQRKGEAGEERSERARRLHLTDTRHSRVLKMMKRLLVLLSVIAAGAFSSCVGTGYTVEGKAAKGVRKVYVDGTCFLIAEKRSAVLVTPLSDTGLKSGAEENFLVMFENGSSKSQVFSEENISGSYRNDKGEVKSLKVFSYGELVKKEKARQGWAALGVALGGMGDAMSAANAGYSNTYGSYSGTSYTGYGSVNTYGNFNATTYDYGAAQAASRAAQARTDANFSRLRAQGSANLGYLSGNILKKQTVLSGGSHSGLVRVQMPAFTETGELIFRVKMADGEYHTLVFDVSKPK